MEKLERLLEEAAPFTVCFLDIDHLKQVNDKYGHGEGDRYLVSAADILEGVFRGFPVCRRVGMSSWSYCRIPQRSKRRSLQEMPARIWKAYRFPTRRHSAMGLFLRDRREKRVWPQYCRRQTSVCTPIKKHKAAEKRKSRKHTVFPGFAFHIRSFLLCTLRAGMKLLIEGWLLSGSSIFMKNSLCNSLVDLLHGNTHCNGLVSGVILQSGIGFLDLSFELRIGGPYSAEILQRSLSHASWPIWCLA